MHMPDKWNRVEQEAVYMIREAAEKTRELTFLCQDAQEKERIWELATAALFPEKPVVSFWEEDDLDEVEYPEMRPTGQERTLLFQMEKNILIHRPQMWHLYNLTARPGQELILRPYMGLFSRFWKTPRKPLYKLITCGGVDDGKSTLIGRLLFETKSKEEKNQIYQRKELLRSDGTIDFALLSSESKEENEQGITITVSYSWFESQKNSFLMADTPGHEEYTKNMAYGASGADLAVIMIAAEKGIVPQTRRHIRICSFMGIRKFVFAVNKMDLCGYSERVFQQVSQEIMQFMESYEHQAVKIIPVAAKSGVNLTNATDCMPWYQAGHLLEELDQLAGMQVDESEVVSAEQPLWLPVQRICKSSQMEDNKIEKRQYQGQISSGSLWPGQELYVLPSGESACVEQISGISDSQGTFETGDQVSLIMKQELNISPGSILTDSKDYLMEDRFQLDLLWMSDHRLKSGNRYLFKLNAQQIPAVVTRINYITDSNTGDRRTVNHLTKNMFARCEISLMSRIPILTNQSAIKPEILLIDRKTGETVAYGRLGKILQEEQGFDSEAVLTRKDREKAMGQKAYLILAPENEESGRFLHALEGKLMRSGLHTLFLEGRKETNSESLAEIQKEKILLLMEAGLIVLYQGTEAEQQHFLEDMTLQSRVVVLESVANQLDVLQKTHRMILEERIFGDS